MNPVINVKPRHVTIVSSHQRLGLPGGYYSNESNVEDKYEVCNV
jgi:hypothetical protein